MRTRLLTGWDAQRLLRLVFAGVFLAAGMHGHEPLAFGAAAFFGLQAVFNVGCCGAGSCAVSRSSNAPPEEVQVKYEEIK